MSMTGTGFHQSWIFPKLLSGPIKDKHRFINQKFTGEEPARWKDVTAELANT